MKWELDWNDPFTHYLEAFETLVGDRRTWITLTETVKGIVSSGSLVCQRIAAHSPILGRVTKGAQRIIRLVRGTTIKRSPDLDAAHLIAQLRTHAVAHLASAPSDELWLIADGSDLRKPYAKALPNLMKVRSLTDGLVNGYQTLTVLGLPFNARQLLALRIVQEKGSISSQEYVDATGVPERTALRELRDMVDRGIFVVRGKAHNTRYHRAF
jgi:hypothetical protein